MGKAYKNCVNHFPFSKVHTFFALKMEKKIKKLGFIFYFHAFFPCFHALTQKAVAIQS